MSVPCAGCAAPCCRNYVVGLWAYDVYRIATRLALPMADFCTLVWRDAADADHQIVLDAAALPRRYYALTLAKVPDPDPQRQKRCVFLVSIGGRGRCGAYAARPQVCRLYPTTELHGVISASGGGLYCPPGSWQIADLNLDRARVTWREQRAQRALHDALVAAWNRLLQATPRPRSEREFLDFLAAALRRLEEQDPEGFHAPASWPAGYGAAALEVAP